MVILKKGEIPKKTKDFKCGFCSTEFRAEEGEYKSAGQMAYFYDGVSYECTCPLCGKTAWV